MTVSYSADVATVRGMPSCFVRLLKRWRGSIYKIIYFDLIVFLSGYYALSMIYRYLLDKEQKEEFHKVVSYFKENNSLIPISFVLGFYVSIVVERWTNQFKALPWPDATAVYVSTHIRGQDERGRKMRRTVMRYVNLSMIMVYVMISPKVKKRFPTYDHLIEAGVLVENEKKILVAMDEIYPKQSKYWMPIVWASSILTRARKEARIRDDYALRALNDSINYVRECCITLVHYDVISIPLVYTQVVSLAVYSYFFAAVIGQQWTTERNPKTSYTNAVDPYFPVYTTLEFFFYMGWLKVAESLICPFGEDDDDFDINYMIDRNLQISYLIVDEMHNRHPQLIKDLHWDEVYPYELLGGGGGTPPEHSTAHLGVTPDIRQSDADFEKSLRGDSLIHLLFKRSSASVHGSKVLRSVSLDSSESDESIKEKVWKITTPVLSPPQSSTLTLLPEEEHAEDELTFEKLREEREREKIERQQQKVQRTVENVADIAAEMPKITTRRPRTKEPTSHEESPHEESEEDEKKTDPGAAEKKEKQKPTENDANKKEEERESDEDEKKKKFDRKSEQDPEKRD